MDRELIKIIEFSYLFTFSFGAIRQLKLPFAVLIRYLKPGSDGLSPQRISNPTRSVMPPKICGYSTGEIPNAVFLECVTIRFGYQHGLRLTTKFKIVRYYNALD